MSCPRPFYQFLTFLGLKIDRKIPLIWSFADGKTAAHYTKNFQKVKSKISENWEPAQIISDFERAIIPAVETEFPHSFHKGCYVHFSPKLFIGKSKNWVQCSVQRRQKIAFLHKVLNGDPFCAPQKNCELILNLCNTAIARMFLKITQFWPSF